MKQKWPYWILMTLAISGCATLGSSKEDVRDIFQLVKEKRFDEAEGKFRSSQGIAGMFSTYSGNLDAVNRGGSGDNVRDLLDQSKGAIEYCEKKLDEIKAITITESPDLHLKIKLENLENTFNGSCEKNLDKNWSFVTKIQKYSTVDLNPLFKEYQVAFNGELSRIESETKRIETDFNKDLADRDQKRKEFEQSPEYHSKKLCEMQNIVDGALAIISKENQAAELSGFVNKKKMYDAGQAIRIN